ncbi:hypothetical protein GF352_04730 [archaeon]|nr:hypothetical protein [archaeon]
MAFNAIHLDYEKLPEKMDPAETYVLKLTANAYVIKNKEVYQYPRIGKDESTTAKMIGIISSFNDLEKIINKAGIEVK